MVLATSRVGSLVEVSAGTPAALLTRVRELGLAMTDAAGPVLFGVPGRSRSWETAMT